MSSDALQFVREDDFVEYYVFPFSENQLITIEEEDAFLQTLLMRIKSFSDKYCEHYIWHKDKFKLTPRNSSSRFLIESNFSKGVTPIHLHGVTHYGDNIQDEWFIVSLLLALTKEIKGLIARVVDSDGEFLLIEAAEYLPTWASPQTCEQRVFIHNGSVHIIPLEASEQNGAEMMEDDGSNDDDDEIIPDIQILPLIDALGYVLNNPSQSIANDNVQESIKKRVVDFPNGIVNHLHHATAYVPEAIARLLEKDPQLIAPAVRAFCNRDQIDMKACRAMKYFPPENRTYCRITFTKCLYAMLTHSKYLPDRRIGWNLPHIKDNNYKSHSLGVKIACGFEILTSQAKEDDDIEGDKTWISYLKKLNDRGYFQGFLEKSQTHNKLVEQAKQYYLEHRDGMKITPTIGRKILQLLKTLGMDAELNQSREQNELPIDDDESWLLISPEALDEMMKTRYGEKCNLLTTNDNANASILTGKIDEFLEHRSGIDGVEFSEEDVDLKFNMPVKPKRGIFKNKESLHNKTKAKQDVKVDFDPQAFTCAIQNILDFKIPEESWDQSSDSEMSEYNDNEVTKGEYLEQSNFKSYMDQMDKELASTTIGKSFKQNKTKHHQDSSDDNFDEVEDFKPVDVDLNTLKSMMKSYEGEMGSSGPASNLLGSIGVRLEPDMHVE